MADISLWWFSDIYDPNWIIPLEVCNCALMGNGVCTGTDYLNRGFNRRYRDGQACSIEVP